jgi:hypothetical protein
MKNLIVIMTLLASTSVLGQEKGDLDWNTNLVEAVDKSIKEKKTATDVFYWERLVWMV